MPKSKGREQPVSQLTPSLGDDKVILGQGFYVVNGKTGEIRTRTVNKGKGEERVQVTEPIKLRTIGGAKDSLALADNPALCVLFVPTDGFKWGE